MINEGSTIKTKRKESMNILHGIRLTYIYCEQSYEEKPSAKVEYK